MAEHRRHGERGTLPTSAHWLTDSRVVFLRKPGTDQPRPIRVGELWRRVVAKGMAAEAMVEEELEVARVWEAETIGAARAGAMMEVAD